MTTTRWMSGALAALLACPVALAPPARATTLRAVPLSQLVDEAELIVVAEGLATDAFWADPAATRIKTQTRMRVLRTWKGAATPGGETIDVVTLGGQMGDVAQVVPGAARLPVGGVAVLFLVRARGHTGEYEVLALGQGIWHVGAQPGEVGADTPVSQDTVAPTRAPAQQGAGGALGSMGDLERKVAERVAAGHGRARR